MHRRLREQESVRAYVQVIHRALQLRCAETQTHSCLIVSKLPFSEAATAEISPNRPIIVSKYRALQALVSAIKQGCFPASDVTDEVGISLRLVSFLEETQGHTWSNMKAVLYRYVIPTSNTCSLDPSDFCA